MAIVLKFEILGTGGRRQDGIQDAGWEARYRMQKIVKNKCIATLLSGKRK